MRPTTHDAYQWQEIACSLKRPDWVWRAFSHPFKESEGIFLGSQIVPKREVDYSPSSSVEVESAQSFTTRPVLLQGVVLNKAPLQLTIYYALPVNIFFLYPNFVMQIFCCVLLRHRIARRYEIVRRVTVVVQFLGYLSIEVKITFCWCPHPVGKSFFFTPLLYHQPITDYKYTSQEYCTQLVYGL
jgi:hypothetical protein